MKSKGTPESIEFKITCYRNALKLQWWLATHNIPMEYSNKLNRKELIMLKDIIEEDIKNSEA